MTTPEIAQKAPYAIDVETGVFCDGAHSKP